MMKIISNNKYVEYNKYGFASHENEKFKSKRKMKASYTRLEERKTLIRCGTVFFVNPQEFGARLPWFLGLLKLRISLRFDKKYFARYHFRFVIFSLV